MGTHGDLPISGAHSGTYYVAMGNISNGTLTQGNLATTSGQTYTLDFWLAAGTNTPVNNDFGATFNGVPVFIEKTNIGPQGWTEYTYNVVATTTNSSLTFNFQDTPGYLALDDVSLSGASATPLPSSAWGAVAN